MIDILSVGEVLIDCIGTNEAPLSHTAQFQRHLGGSPVNVACNVAKLNLKSALIASCGRDGLGDYIYSQLNDNHVQTQLLNRTEVPTSIILVSKSKATPEFIAYRAADYHFVETQFSEQIIEQSKIYHTTCFALSKNPARNFIIEGAKTALKFGKITSIDLNYAPAIWPNRQEAHLVISEFMKCQPLLKISNDDCLRFFNEALNDDAIFKHFHDWGAKIICLTKGKEGVVVSDGKITFFKPANYIEEVVDTTGAGDAFWSGFLFAYLNKLSLEKCVNIGQQVATLKLKHLGPFPKDFDLLSKIDH